jgi:RNA polymerase sigma factor (sigma-70 family)
MRCAVKCKSPSDERSAGNRHATFCGSRGRFVAPGDPVTADLPTNDADPSGDAAVQQRIEALERAVRRLSPRMRTTLLLHRRDGYSLDEIGQQLGISRNVAKKYLAKALNYCRQNLRRE